MESEGQVKIYECPSYQSTFKDGLHSIREKFCDAKLVAGEKIFKGHKVILAALSRYFYFVFVHNFNERDSEEVRMPPEIDAIAMETLLDYFYSGELALSQSNIQSVFTATDYMRLDPLLEICAEYMQETLSPSNCVPCYTLTATIQYSSLRLEGLKKAASVLIVGEAVKVSGSDDFLSLSMEHILKILKSNNEPEKAEFLYALIIKWVGHDEATRKQFLYELLQTLAVEGISDDFITSKMRSDHLLRNDLKAFQWLFDTFMPRPASSIQATQSQCNSLFITDRLYIRKCFLVDVQTPTPLPIRDRPEMSRFSVVSHKRRIYLLCGEETEKSYLFNDPQKKWVNCELNLKFGRQNAECIVFGDALFVIGGHDWTSKSNLDSCMKFNFVSGQKENLAPMREKRQLPGVAVYANSLYVSCGYLALPSIERYDTREGRWSEVGEYTTEIGSCSSAIVGDYLYSCDVNSGDVERFDPRINRSQKICSLPLSDENGNRMSSIEGELFGADGGHIFKYDIAADKWEDFCSGMDLRLPIIVPWI